jgi:hypothetical protein
LRRGDEPEFANAISSSVFAVEQAALDRADGVDDVLALPVVSGHRAGKGLRCQDGDSERHGPGQSAAQVISQASHVGEKRGHGVCFSH